MSQFPISIRYSDTTLSISFVHDSASNDTRDVLEEIFAQWNAGSGRECYLFQNNRCRSLSVGDYVKVGDQWYRCASFGWDQITKESVDQWFSEMEAMRQSRTPGRTYVEERQLLWFDKRRVEDKLGVTLGF